MSGFSVDVAPPVRETAPQPAEAAEAVAGAATAAGAPDDIIPNVDEGTVRSILQGAGFVLNTLDRPARSEVPEIWRWLPEELDQIVPPLTRAANRSEALRRALVHGDIVAISLALGTYGARNVGARQEALKGERKGKTDRTNGPGPGGPIGSGPAGAGAPYGGHVGPGFPPSPGTVGG